MLVEHTLAVVLETSKAFAAVGVTERDVDTDSVVAYSRGYSVVQVDYPFPGRDRHRQVVGEASLRHPVEADEALPMDESPWS